jgi:hypothetical protein
LIVLHFVERVLHRPTGESANNHDREQQAGAAQCNQGHHFDASVLTGAQFVSTKRICPLKLRPLRFAVFFNWVISPASASKLTFFFFFMGCMPYVHD